MPILQVNHLLRRHVVRFVTGSEYTAKCARSSAVPALTKLCAVPAEFGVNT